MPEGHVCEVWRYPVKSMAGERVDALRVDWRGGGGDRTHAVLFEHKGVTRPLTAREAPALLRFGAAYPGVPGAVLDPADPPAAAVTVPGGEVLEWGDERLVPLLREATGREVGLRRDPEGQQDLGRSLLLTTEASRAALEAELGEPVDLRRFRTNLHLDLDAPAWADLGWEGRRVRFTGGVVLELLHPCVRCVIPTRDPATTVKWPALLRHLDREHATSFGINARVLAAGTIAQGEAAEVV